jgi:hypothetical protein
MMIRTPNDGPIQFLPEFIKIIQILSLEEQNILRYT